MEPWSWHGFSVDHLWLTEGIALTKIFQTLELYSIVYLSRPKNFFFGSNMEEIFLSVPMSRNQFIYFSVSMSGPITGNVTEKDIYKAYFVENKIFIYLSSRKWKNSTNKILRQINSGSIACCIEPLYCVLQMWQLLRHIYMNK